LRSSGRSVGTEESGQKMRSLFIRYIKRIHCKELVEKKGFLIRPCGDITKQKVATSFVCVFPWKLTVSIVEIQQVIEL
jgi:hypothetical protein